MPICPNCKAEFRQRKDGGCPSCGEALSIKDGVAYRESLGSPTVSLLEHFEHAVSEKTSRIQRKLVIHRIPRRSPLYRRELIEAEKLLALCEHDYDLAAGVITLLFNNKQFYRNYTSLIGIQRDFLLAKSILEANLAKAAAEDQKQSAYYDSMTQRENIFASD